MTSERAIADIAVRASKLDHCSECGLPYAICNAIATAREAFMRELPKNSFDDEFTEADGYYLAKPFERGARDAIAAALAKARNEQVKQ
jgi:hypothetical protein